VADELRIGLQELLRKAMIEQDADFLKEGVRVLSQALMDMEVQEHVGAAPHERSTERVGQRNGYRQRSWDTRVGTVELKVPRVRDSSYFPSLLEPRRKAERALSAVVQEAYVHGVSTRKVDELVKALGMGGISKSRVSELCEELDEEVERFRSRPPDGSYPYVWVDATYLKARQDGRVTSTAVVIAVGVNAQTGEREVPGLDVGPSEDGAFWSSFLRSLVARGLSGVRLVTSDAHRGLKDAIEKVLQGVCWQRCRVHFMRNALSLVPKAAQQMVGATIRTVFAQPDSRSAHQQWRKVADGFRGRFPKLSELNLD
jgi:putative transposase